VIVEPVQGLAGAVDLGAPFLGALRARCDEVGALLIFDEVQCGVGRTGQPFAANLYGVRPDMLTTAKALGNGFPCAVLMLSPLVAASLKPESLGTTFGGGPMACAAIEAVIASHQERAAARACAARGRVYPQDLCPGPGHRAPGRGPARWLRTTRPAKEIQAELLECCILTGTASDPHVLRLLPPLILAEEHVDLLRDALRDLPA